MTIPKNILCAAGLLFILVMVVYTNNISGSWHLDDHTSIVNNPKIRMESVSYGAIWDATHASLDRGWYKGLHIYRPISMLSFAVNWLIAGKKTTIYHLTNNMIHFLTAFFLFLTISKLCRRKGYFLYKNRYSISLFAAALWAVHPVNTQAVSYIVQRMAVLAAMFTVLGIYFYLKFRNEGKWWFLGASAVCGLLAFGSKENGIMFLASIGFVETIFYRDFEMKTVWLGIGGVLVLVGTAFIFLTMPGDPLGYMEGYEGRPFTMWQRFFTQGKILFFYLSQYIYPLASRFSIMHEFEYSTLMPLWSVGIAAVLLLAASGIKRTPILSFAVLFYFLNHVIESSILPLELAFEHRNYLPGMFLMFPVAVGIVRLIDHAKTREFYRLDKYYAFWVTVLLIFLGLQTYTRNKVWENDRTLWENAAIHAPSQARPLRTLALWYSMNGQEDKALDLYVKSLSLKDPRKEYTQAVVLTNMATIFYKRAEYDNVIKLASAALRLHPAYRNARVLVDSAIKKKVADG